MQKTGTRKKRRHTGARRRGSGLKTFLERRKIGVKLTVCAAVLAVSILFRLLFPSAYMTAYDHMSGSVDFKSAFGALGEGIGGERKLSEALADAYYYAFIADKESERVNG